jgi:hypothetical protein
VTQALLLVTGSIAGSLPVIAAAFTAVILSWLRAVMSLGAQLKEYEQQKAKEAEAAAAASPNGTAEPPVGGLNGAGGAGTPTPAPATSPQAA